MMTFLLPLIGIPMLLFGVLLSNPGLFIWGIIITLLAIPSFYIECIIAFLFAPYEPTTGHYTPKYPRRSIYPLVRYALRTRK